MARVALTNLSTVDPHAVEDVVVAAQLPDGHIWLVVGDELLTDEFQAATIPKAFTPFAGNLYGLARFIEKPWDCGIVIGNRWANRQGEFPAYFAYLLEHEFGHASTALTRLDLTAYEDMILRFISRAAPERHWRWDDLPHEVYYDRFGLAVAVELFGTQQVESEVQTLISSGLSHDELRLEKLLTLDATLSLDGLPTALAEFALPHRDALLALWGEAVRDGQLQVAGVLTDLEQLWTQPG